MAQYNENGLTAREEKFARLYAKYVNGFKAAKEAGYSEKTCRTIACNLLHKDKILDRIKYYQEHLAECLEISAEQIASELLEIARTRTENTRDRIRAYEDVNEMCGFVKTKATEKINAKVEGDGNGGFTLSIEVKNEEESDDLDKLGDF